MTVRDYGSFSQVWPWWCGHSGMLHVFKSCTLNEASRAEGSWNLTFRWFRKKSSEKGWLVNQRWQHMNSCGIWWRRGPCALKYPFRSSVSYFHNNEFQGKEPRGRGNGCFRIGGRRQGTWPTPRPLGICSYKAQAWPPGVECKQAPSQNKCWTGQRTGDLAAFAKKIPGAAGEVIKLPELIWKVKKSRFELGVGG